MIADTIDRGPTRAPSARLAPDVNALIERHLGLAARVAAQYRGLGLDADELDGVAGLAVVEAAHRYDVAEFPEESFARYAERAIRSRIREAIARAPAVGASERSGRRGRGGWSPHGVSVERMGLMTGVAGDVDDVLGEALAECTDRERELVALMYCDGLTAIQAGRRMGLQRRESRELYRGAMAGLQAAFRARGFELPADRIGGN